MNRSIFTTPKLYIYPLFVLLFMLFMITSVHASMTIGTKIGEVLSTDIIATIEEKPIPSMNINGYTAIVVEDLRAYGFDVVWNEQDRSLKVTRNEMKTTVGKEFVIERMEPGAVLKPVLFTDIKTYFDGKEIISFNIDGQTAIYFNHLKPYGEIQWNEKTRIASFEFPVPAAIPEPVTPVNNDNIIVTRQSTQMNPENSAYFHQPIDKTSMPEHISVGLFFNDTSVSSVSLSSGNGFNIGTYDEVFNTIFSISDTQQLVVQRDASHYIGLNSQLKNVSEAQKLLQKLKDNKMTALMVHEDKGWNVFVGPYKSLRDAEDEMDYHNLDPQEWDPLNISNDLIRVSDLKNNPVLLYRDNAPLYISDLSTSINQSILQVGNEKYRGAITIRRHNDHLLTVINRLPIEQYLYGVVPREMPATWHTEALKAQAVAARGFALANIGKYVHLGFDVCNTVNSQVYGGYNSEKPAATKAVDETYGKIMAANGELVIPYYHSNSGGQTESSENVWSAAVSYVRGVYDPYSIDAPHGQWQETISLKELETKLMQNQINIGNVIDLAIIELSPNGRVLELEIRGTSGKHIVYKQEARWTFGLKSNYYTLTMNNNSVIFTGYGYGHGVGMSQHGARVMAESGFSWQQILHHYFTDIRIE